MIEENITGCCRICQTPTESFVGQAIGNISAYHSGSPQPTSAIPFDNPIIIGALTAIAILILIICLCFVRLHKMDGKK